MLGIFVSNWRRDDKPVKEDYKRNDIATFVIFVVASLVFTAGSMCILWNNLQTTFILWTIGKNIF